MKSKQLNSRSCDIGVGWKTHDWRLRIVATLLLFLIGALGAVADTNHWKQGESGYDVTCTAGNGYFTLRYCTYDTEGALAKKDDFLRTLQVKLEFNEQKIDLFSQVTFHEDDDRFSGYSLSTINTSPGGHHGYVTSDTKDINDYGFKWEYENLNNNDDVFYTKVTVTLPKYLWGKFKVILSGYWYFQNDDDNPLKYNISFDNLDAGNPRFDYNSITFVPTIDPSADKITAAFTNLPNIKYVTTNVMLKSSKGASQEFTASNSTQSFVYDLPSSENITESLSITANVSFKYGNTFNRDAITKTTQPFANATNAVADFDPVNRNVELKWDVEKEPNAEVINILRRKGSGAWALIDSYGIPSGSTAATNTRTYVDSTANQGNNQLTYGGEHEYKIAYSRRSWGTISGDANWKGIATTKVKTDEAIPIELNGERIQSGVKLIWTIPLNYTLKGCNINIYRKGQDDTSFSLIATTKHSQETGEYEDKNITGSYDYYIELDAKGTWYDTKFKSETINGVTIDVSSVTELRASKGDFAGRVHLEWDMANATNPDGSINRTTYKLYRKSCETDDAKETQLYTTSSTDDFLMYDDNSALPGIYYEYRLSYETLDTEGKPTKPRDKKDIGFSLSSGKIVGSITYGSGTAVEGVDVVALRSGSANDMSSSRCLNFNGNGLATVSDTISKFENVFNGEFTYQFWMKIDKGLASGSFPVKAADGNKIELVKNADGTYSIKYHDSKSTSVNFSPKLKADEYYQVTVSRTALSITLTIYKQEGDIMVAESDTKSCVWNADDSRSGYFTIGEAFKGKIDELRVWSRTLTEKEIADNYNRALVGNEDKLEMYYRFDEGLKTQFFDSSRKGSTLNGNHGELNLNVTSSIDVPTTTQFGYRGTTDENGNYIIEGIPFGGDGTSYSVIPQLGIHEFSPTKQLRYIGPSSLVHNATDFTDVSSFPVSGVVYYKNTLYPVEGSYLYVDGNICSRDGEIIETDKDGRFTIDVPIGDHFIEVRNPQQGHTFADGGRYPADPNKVGLKYTFNKTMSGLTFYESTLVNLSGRVTGGSIEGDKPLGFNMSKNTIGQVELQLQATNDIYSLNVVKDVDKDGVISYNNNTATLACEAAKAGAGEFKSTSWRGAKTGENDKTNTIYIMTDPETGEFSAMVPPLKYKVISAKVSKSGTPVISSENGYPEYDLTNPMLEEADSVETEDGYLKYVCNKSIMITYHTQPTFTVQDMGAEEGAFGMKQFTVTDKFGEVTIDDIYTVDNDGNVSYRYGAPLFEMCEPYSFKLKGYEEYINADNGKLSTVPLEGVEVNIANSLADEQSVYYEGENAGQVAEFTSNLLTLNERGEGTYKWKGGLPNISESSSPDVPNYTRTISMSYTIDGKTYQWSGSGMYGILLGELTTGTNFVTAGPDKVDMVLRDPPGTGSHAEWTSGTATVKTTTVGGTWNMDETVITHTALGADVKTVNGMGVASITSVDAEHDIDVGVHIVDEGEGSGTTTTTYTVERTISTSDSPDFVGSSGDVYIGRSTNTTFGKARQISLTRESASAPVEITKKDVITTGLEFATAFNYTQNYIENVLIPNLEAMLDQKLVTLSNGEIDAFTNNTSEPIYLTPYSPGDENYGKPNFEGIDLVNAILNGESTSNGPNYWMIPPKNADPDECYADEVNWIFNQIECWKKTIANNEKDKVEAYYEKNKECFIRNVSFDGGAKVSYSEQSDTTKNTTIENTFTTTIIAGNNWGVMINKTGVVWELATENGAGIHSVQSSDTTNVATFVYELAEDGGDDALSVDVLKSPAGWSPIFHTRAGQTSAPYEGREDTQYYEPGKYVLNEATMQIEVPKLAVEVPVVSDVPTGSAANFSLLLSNESEVNCDIYYKLLALDGTNQNGATLKIDGQVLTEGRIIKVPAGETIKKLLQLSQSDLSILDYENIGVALCSQSQTEEIADTVFISAHFVPSSSEVTLHIDSPILNTALGDNLALSFDNFDRNFQGLKAFRLQYKAKGDANWTLAKEYVLNEADLTKDNELLPSGAKVEYIYPMHNNKDNEYTFRVMSVATYGTGEVYRPSNEITVIKDMARPQLISIPSPTDGILNVGDEIAVMFNEDIRQGYLQNDANFIIRGRLNDAEVSHDGVFQSTGGEGAQSQSPIDLSNRSWSVSNWVKWTDAGSIFRHGSVNNNFDIAVLADGKLKVEIAGNSYTSVNAIPKNKWCYMNVSYDYNQGDPRLTADVAYDSESKSLFNREQVSAYQGNGVITIGRGINAAIHEVSLWNNTREWILATSTKGQVLPASTDGLIGYWRLDEGQGNVGEDKARSRHLTLPTSNGWSMETDNFALTLDGTSYAALDMTKTGSDADQNYAFEFWFRGDKQDATASIFSVNGDELELVAAGDSLNLYANGKLNVITTKSCMDNNWHHFALNVLKGSSGMASVYIDGTTMAQISADKIPAMQTDRLILGAHRTYENEGNYTFSNYFNGSFDEVRFWNGTQTATLLRDNMYSKVDDDAPALALYYPFEKTQRDSGNQLETVADLSDHSATQGADVQFGENAYFKPAITTLGLKGAKQMDNVPFSFVASERKILITLNADEELIEGCTLQMTLRDVQDINGNYCNDINWSAYVNQNQLVWAQSDVKVVKEGTADTTFDVDIINSSGEIANWSLTDMPMWLSTDNEAGSLLPMTQKTLHFTVANSAPIGRYEAEIGLRGENKVTTHLIVNLVVTGTRPDWAVSPGDYENTMNMVAQLKIDGKYSESEEDIVAAFIGNECRGIASPVYYPRYDTYFLTMNIYGNNTDMNKPITYKVFDASLGEICPDVTATPAHAYQSDLVAGNLNDPVILNTSNKREQAQSLSKGWNWISLYVNPDSYAVSDVFSSVEDDITLVKSKTASTSMYNGSWTNGGLTNMEIGKMYKVQMNNVADFYLMGSAVNPQAVPVSIYKGWNWIGFNSNGYLSPDEAFAGLEPQTGDVIKGRNAFAMFMDYEWVGSLTALTPGEGYVYMSNDDQTKTFCYPSIAGRSMRAPMQTNGDQPKYTACDEHKYQGNMTMIAKVIMDGEPLDCELAVFDSNGECRATGMSQSDNLIFLTIQGEGYGEQLSFRVVFPFLGKETDVLASETYIFSNDDIAGTPDAPFIINLSEGSGISDIEIDATDEPMYDVLGRRVKKDNPVTGVYIRGNEKVLIK